MNSKTLRRKNTGTLFMAITFVFLALILCTASVSAATKNPSGVPKKGDYYTGTAKPASAHDTNGTRIAGAVFKNHSGNNQFG